MAELIDSGARRNFETGAVRDIVEGKGRCDLLPLHQVAAILDDEIIRAIGDYEESGNTSSLQKAIWLFSDMVFGSRYTAMLEAAKQYEDGCQKYGERNWQKGIPVHCYIDSGVRHYLKLRRGDVDEPHDRAVLWNLLGAIWTHENKPELIDLPFSNKDNPETGNPVTDNSNIGNTTTDNPELEKSKWHKESSSALYAKICSFNVYCETCPLSHFNNGYGVQCADFRHTHPEDFRRVAIEYLEGKE